MLLKRLSDYFARLAFDYSEKFCKIGRSLKRGVWLQPILCRIEGGEGVKGLVNGIIAVSSLTLSRFWPRISFIKRFPVQCNSRNWLLVECSKCEAFIEAAACTANKIWRWNTELQIKYGAVIRNCNEIRRWNTYQWNAMRDREAVRAVNGLYWHFLGELGSPWLCCPMQRTETLPLLLLQCRVNEMHRREEEIGGLGILLQRSECTHQGPLHMGRW